MTSKLIITAMFIPLFGCDYSDPQFSEVEEPTNNIVEPKSKVETPVKADLDCFIKEVDGVCVYWEEVPKDEMQPSTIYVVNQARVNLTDPYTFDERPRMLVVCDNNSTAFGFSAPGKQSFRNMSEPVSIKFTDTPVKQYSFQGAGNAILLDRGKGVPILKAMYGQTNMKVQFATSEKGTQTWSFDITNSKEELLNLSKACNWD